MFLSDKDTYSLYAYGQTVSKDLKHPEDGHFPKCSLPYIAKFRYLCAMLSLLIHNIIDYILARMPHGYIRLD